MAKIRLTQDTNYTSYRRFLAALPVFLDELRNSGFNIGVNEYADVHSLMLKLARAGHMPADYLNLRSLLSPLLCSRPGDFQEFADRFDRWAERFQVEDKEKPEPVSEPHDEVEEMRRLRSFSWMWIAVTVIIALVLFYIVLNTGKEGSPPSSVDIKTPDIGEVITVEEKNGSASSTKIFPLLGMGLLGLVLILGIREAWLRYWVARYLRRRSADGPFDVLPFYVTAGDHPVYRALGLRRAAHAMRRHIQIESSFLDVHATVDQTIRRGNYFTPVYGRRNHRPEYLVLVDRAAFRDHRADWADEMLDFLAFNEVQLKRYDFDRDPRSCIPHSGSLSPVNLDELARRHPRHRLIVFSDGKGLLDPFTCKAAEWIELFFVWDNKALLRLDDEPAGFFFPLDDFVVMQADEDGLIRLIEQWQNGQDLHRPDSLSPETDLNSLVYVADEAERGADKTKAILVLELKLHLGEAGFLWLCACSVYPELRWRLTVHLGRQLKDNSGNQVFERRVLKKMACLPWFRKGSMPDWLRLCLVEDELFRGRHEKAVRKILFELMKTAAEAGNIRLTHGAPEDRLIRRIMKTVRRLSKGRMNRINPMIDQIFFEYMENPLSVKIPMEMRRFFRKQMHRAGSVALKSSMNEAESGKIKIKSGNPTKHVTNRLGMTFVFIPSGTFMMGSPRDEPGRYDDEILHKVILTRGFYLQTTQVTQRQWQEVMGNNPSNFKEGGLNCPVEMVSWNDVQEFINRLNQQNSKSQYRLPTEAEWEYACRAETYTPYTFGECLLTSDANYDGNSPLQGCPKGENREKTTPVGILSENKWGLYDIHGNVYEWCYDWYGDYPTKPVVDPIGPLKGSVRVIRGGSWCANARYSRSAVRNYGAITYRDNDLGFRLLKITP